MISEPSGQSEHSDTDQFVDAEDYIDDRETDTQITISTVNTTIMDAESTGAMDETLFSSQIQPGHDQVTTTVSQFTSTPTHVLHMPQYQHIPHIPHMSAMLQMSFSQPQPQPGLSDTDVIRIATLVKQMLTDEIGRLVKERVEIETAELRNTVTTLQAENKKLTDAITELEVKFSTRIDDLEQYGRRPCL